MKITLITSNLNKVKEFKEILEPEIQVIHKKLEYKELRSDDTKEIAEESAIRLANELKQTVVVEDSGLFIDALNGYPGTVSAYSYKRIGLQGILKLMENKTNRKAHYKSVIAYAEPNKTPISFEGTEELTIAKEERGTNGWGHDPIVIPKGETQTYAEKTTYDKKFRKIAIKKLKDYLLKS